MALVRYLCVFILTLYISLSLQEDQNLKSQCDPFAECKKSPMDIMFVIDASTSIWKGNFTEALWFIQDFVKDFEIQPDSVRVATVTYSDRAFDEDAITLDAYTNVLDLTVAISNIPYRNGNTSTGEGIRYMREKLMNRSRPWAEKVCVVLTDGKSQNPDLTAQQARITRKANVKMFAVGIGGDISWDELRKIAGIEEHVFYVRNYDSLKIIRSHLASGICTLDHPHWQQVCRDHPVDISLVVDASASIGEADFIIGMKFLRDFIGSFDISTKRARFSLITYGDGTYSNTAIDFDDFTDEVSLVDAIDRIPYKAGRYTGTGEGIKFMRERQMTKSRRNVERVAIVLTDGNSQNQEMTQNEAAMSRRAGIDMFAVGVGSHISDEELRQIAGRSDHVFRVNAYRALEMIRKDLNRQTCFLVLRPYNQTLQIADLH